MSFARTQRSIADFHPEMRLGGYSAHDETIEFYTRVKLLSRPDDIAVDFGAGRGAWFDEDESEFRKSTRSLKGTVARVIGIDMGKAIGHNRSVDVAMILPPDGRWPVGASSADFIVCD